MNYLRPILLLVAATAIFSGIYLLRTSNQRIRQQAEGLATVHGHLDGEHTLVSGKVAGRVKWLPVGEGDCLTKGQVVAELEGDAGSSLADRVITAPMDGVVVTKMAKAEDMLQAGSPLIDIVDQNTLFLHATVPETLIGKLRVGLAARVYVDDFPEQPFEATLREVVSNAEATPDGGQASAEQGKPIHVIKLSLKREPNRCLVPGQLAAAVIRWKEGTPWAKPHL